MPVVSIVDLTPCQSSLEELPQSELLFQPNLQLKRLQHISPWSICERVQRNLFCRVRVMDGVTGETSRPARQAARKQFQMTRRNKRPRRRHPPQRYNLGLVSTKVESAGLWGFGGTHRQKALAVLPQELDQE